MADATESELPVRGRLNGSGPIAVIDIGSNSVRLVVYERLSRAPTTLFNEKVLAGLGRGVGKTGRLANESVALALSTLVRFRRICDQSGVKALHVLATAAARDAENGAEFIADAERICGVEVKVLSGKDEARLSAYGIMSGIWHPAGIVGDLGGGSLELVEVDGETVGRGKTLPLGGIRLQEQADGKPAKAQKIAGEHLQKIDWLEGGEGKDFYAVGGTWRSLGRLHLFQEGYPLHVMHDYSIALEEAIDFCQMVVRRDVDSIDCIEAVSKARRPLLAFGAAVMERTLRRMKPRRVVFSALGVREGLLFDLMLPEARAMDPLVEAARELSLLRSRSPAYAEELIDWTGRLFAATGIDETDEEKRLREASCLLSDIGWRAHPDYRGEQSLNIISNAGFVGVDHAGRAYLALAVYYRHQGLIDDALSPRIRELASSRIKERARILGAALRVASVITASVEGILPLTEVVVDGDSAMLRLSGQLADLDGERLRKRMSQFAKLVGMKGIVLPLP